MWICSLQVEPFDNLENLSEINMLSPEGELKISFGYQCNDDRGIPCKVAKGCKILPEMRRTSSFSCLSGAALSANATLANTNICNGVIGEEILPNLDSPNSFRRVPSSPCLGMLDMLSSSFQSSLSNLSCSPSSPSLMLEYDPCSLRLMSPSSRNESFLNATEVQVAGGAAGEDRVQAVCSEENGWLFCAIYDGFNGRDAADYLACTLYDSIVSYLNTIDWNSEPNSINASDNVGLDDSCILDHGHQSSSDKSFSNVVLDSLKHVLNQSSACNVQYSERARLLAEHPDDPKTIVAGRVKGKLKVTRAFGVGYLKKKILNDALMGILRVQDLRSPPYVSTDPSLNVHKISPSDQFVIVASDGLFDFFSNEEAVNLVESYILRNPHCDPAKYLIEKLVTKAADSAGFSTEELMNVPAGSRRKYHDDVTVMVIILGMNKRTSKASICI
ncbi:unnamed protein product [Vicia faba]|uniref:PPM-type phosphatase domain-containing protein n=1 Tax=Vicia faba TaxID=3906 RepID=A0AAV0YZC8_VICFA|nr:unnamed protein product [Vicia faba]